jgi:mannose-6-phosphate isomerase-like protein (cupin superfamily)
MTENAVAEPYKLRRRHAPPTHGAAMTAPIGPFDLADLGFSPTAALFEGERQAGVGISMFVARTRPGGAIELHVHPYPETFLLLAGRGRWTAGETVVELEPDQMLVVPPNTPHGFRNIGEEPLLVVTVHEAGVVDQTFLGREPA